MGEENSSELPRGSSMDEALEVLDTILGLKENREYLHRRDREKCEYSSIKRCSALYNDGLNIYTCFVAT